VVRNSNRTFGSDRRRSSYRARQFDREIPAIEVDSLGSNCADSWSFRQDTGVNPAEIEVVVGSVAAAAAVAVEMVHHVVHLGNGNLTWRTVALRSL
jgi:hypothetical protein